MTQRFPKLFRGNLKFELNLSNYAINFNFKKAVGVDTLTFGKNVGLLNPKLKYR